jgi:hypothetical protein
VNNTIGSMNMLINLMNKIPRVKIGNVAGFRMPGLDAVRGFGNRLQTEMGFAWQDAMKSGGDLFSGRSQVNIGGGSDLWRPLDEGIRIEHYNTQSSNSYPLRYERYAQIEIWPKCDGVRTLRIWYVMNLGAFTADADEATLDDELILLHATATAKAHYRQPDAGTWGTQLDAMLARIRGKSFGNKRYLPPGKEEMDLIPRPVVV